MRRTLISGLALACAALLVTGPPGLAAPRPAVSRPSEGAVKGGGKLARQDRIDLGRRAARRASADVMLLGRAGQGDEVAAAVRARGGRVRSVSDRVGWVTARMPAGKALDLEDAAVVRAIGLDRKVTLPRDRTARPAAEAARPTAVPPDDDTGAVNAYLPTGDIGAPQFVAGHDEWDGRGVSIAVLDTGVDWTAPGLARTTTGDRKVTRWMDTTGEGLARTSTPATVEDGRFTAAGATWTAPDGVTGAVRFGVLEERTLAPAAEDNDLSQDLNRDGDGDDVFGILVTGGGEAALTVRVDTDLDRSFTAETALTDWNVSGATGRFGRDDEQTTGVTEQVAFGVLPCSEADDNPCAGPLPAGGAPGDAWTFAFDGGTHGTNVASIAAGNDLEPGDGASYDGVAPGAELWAVRVLRSNGSSTGSSVGDGMVRAAERGADVINMSLGGLPVINVGSPSDPQASLVDQLTSIFGVTFAIAAGNDGPGINTVGSPGTAATAVTAGASITPATWASNYDRPGVPSEGLIYFSSVGPLEDGAFKPDVVAPGSALAAVPGWLDWSSDIFAAGTLPPGYAVFQGTSMASPQVAGTIALLAGAAGRTRTPYTPHSLKRAIELGARPLDGGSFDYQPIEEGHGLVQVERAWSWLRRVGVADRDVTAATGSFLLGSGPGGYDRERFSGLREYQLTTLTGGAHRYRLSSSDSWLTPGAAEVTVPGSPGTDDTGAPAPGTASFTARFATTLATRPGVYAGVIRADDPSTPDPADLEILNTVVTPHTFSPRNANGWRFAGSGERGGIEAEKVKRFYFEVPEGAGALQLSALSRAAERSGLVMYVTDPLGTPYAPSTGAFVPGGRADVTVPQPLAGTWEVALHARERAIPGVDERPRERPVVPFHGYELTAKLLTVTVDPATWTADPATPGQTVTSAFTATNTGAAFTGHATGTELVASARERRELIGSAGEQRIPVTVEEGTTELAVWIGNPSDRGADLDLYLYDPTGNVYDYSADGDSEEAVRIADPAPGGWTIGVDPYSVPAATTDYDLRIDRARPGLGSITTDDEVAEHPSGSRWTFTGSVTVPPAAPAAGSVWSGRVVIRDDRDAEVSGAEVTLRP